MSLLSRVFDKGFPCVLLLLVSTVVFGQESVDYQSPGGYSFTVPEGVSEVMVDVWGAGGAGGRLSGFFSRGATGGGGGGAFARSRFAVEPGRVVTVQVGGGGTASANPGDSWVSYGGQVFARAEAGANAQSNGIAGGRGGRTSQSIGNEVRRPGGSGATGVENDLFDLLQAGGGGSSAGPSAAGTDGNGENGGVAPAGGGDGGNGSVTSGSTSGNGFPGVPPGGGGGGATKRLFGGGVYGGAGGNGQVTITYEVLQTPEIDHFEIVHDGVALTCQPETVTIRACETADCSSLFTEPVAVTLSPAGWIDGDSFSFSGGQTTRQLQVTSIGSVNLSVSAATPAPGASPGTLCDDGSGVLNIANCQLEYFDAGLAFDVPDLVSHRPSGPVQVRAVRQDDQTQACVPAFGDATKVVQFSSAYVNPDADNRDVSRNVIVNSTPVSGDSNSPTGIGLSFDGNGVAEIDVSYPDAGLLRLSAVYVGSETTDDAGLIMPGSDNFVSVPAGFCVTSGGDCVAGDASCSAFRKAGQQFALSIKAVGWKSDADGDFCSGNLTTPNFELADIPLEVELVAPNEADAVKGELPDNQKAYTHNRSLDATEVVNLSQSEVGVFRFKTAPEPGAYLGRDLPIAVSKPIGRFYPDRFRVTIQEGELGGECDPDDFVYTGQEFGWKLPASALIEPLSVQGDVTRNYTFDGFRRLFAGDITRLDPLELTALNTSDELMVLASDLGPAAFPVVGPGQMEYRYHSDDNFWFEKTLLAKRGPFDPTIQFALTDIQDSDGVETELSRYEFSPEMPAQVRYGRLVMENVYGPETIDLPLALKMPFEVEVFYGEQFARHQADNCTTWNTSGITVVEPPARHTLVASSGTFDDGMGDPLSIDPSGERGNDVLEWNVPVWLQGFWGREPVDSGDPAQDELQNPRATATFGVYRGNDRIIYWREVTD